MLVESQRNFLTMCIFGEELHSDPKKECRYNMNENSLPTDTLNLPYVGLMT